MLAKSLAAKRRVSLAVWLDGQGYPLLSRVVIKNAYEPAVRVGDLVFVSSATPLRSNGTEVFGKVGTDVDMDVAKVAARLCVAHSLSLLRDVVGEPLEKRIRRAVDLMFLINAASSFGDHSEVADAGSDLLIQGLGPAGAHARSAIGVGSLVPNVSVVLKAVYRVRGRLRTS